MAIVWLFRWACGLCSHHWEAWAAPFQFGCGAYQDRTCKRCGIRQQRDCGWMPGQEDE